MKWPDDRSQIRQAYEADGFVVLESLLDANRVADVQANLSRYIAEIVPNVPPMDVFYDDKATRESIRMLPRMHEHDEYFKAMLTGQRLVSIAEFLWDTRAIPRDAAYFNKPARIGEATPPHQDGYYFHINPCEAMTMWMALDEVDEQNGCVRYVKRSHRAGMRPHGRTNVLGFSQGITDFGSASDRDHEVSVCISPGDAIVHDARTIHRAGPNRSGRSRRALGFVYFSARAQFDEAASQRYQANLAVDLAKAGKI